MAQEKTRLLLVDCARLLFAKNGVEETTMNDIAQASGKGRRTLYTYFKSKEDIYMAVVEAELERLSQKLHDVANRDMNPEDKIVAMIYAHLDVIKEVVQRNGNIRAEFFRDIWKVSLVRKNFDRTEVRLLTQIIQEGNRQGIFDVSEEELPLTVDILHYCSKGLEVPYIYGRLAKDMPKGISRAIAYKIVHKALGKHKG